MNEDWLVVLAYFLARAPNTALALGAAWALFGSAWAPS